MRPSEALERGLCPACLGHGIVTRFVPVEGEFPCSTCGGSGKWPPFGNCDECGRVLTNEGHDLAGPVICDECFAKLPPPNRNPHDDEQDA